MRIGTQTWFAENLNYAPSAGTFVSCDEYDCATYGRLYDWSTAMGFASSCNENSCSSQIQSKHRGICPAGWHIPNYDDWDILMDNVGGSSTAGKHLKARSGWENGIENLDTYGFSALPGGGSFLVPVPGGIRGISCCVGSLGSWWSASENEDNSYGDGAYFRHMNYSSDNVYNSDVYIIDGTAMAGGNFKVSLHSVRCLQD